MPRLLRTIGFRLTALYAGLFALSALALFGVVRWTVLGVLDSQLERTVSGEMSALLLDDDADTDLAEIAGRIGERQRNGPALLAWRLFGPDGAVVAGDLPAATPFTGWRDIVMRAPPGDTNGDHIIRALGRSVVGGGTLVVGGDTFEIVELDEAIVRAFGLAGLLTAALAILGGLAASAGFLRRIDAINATTRAIIDGRLSDRVNVRGTDDEIDRLSHNINRMLDRIEALMTSLHQVTNDIAHDLRTPLGRLRHKLEAAQQTEEPERVNALIDEAVEGVDAILATFGAILRIAQIEAGTRRAGFAPVDLSALASRIASAYTAVAEDSGQTLVAEIAGNVTVRGDGELLTQLLVNLVENACLHAGAGAHITLRVAAGAEGTVLSVSDDGPGIPAGERARVFERFVRLDASRTRPGHGLGLALVAAVADLHGARVRLSDNGPGARFDLTFPPAGNLPVQR